MTSPIVSILLHSLHMSISSPTFFLSLSFSNPSTRPYHLHQPLQAAFHLDAQLTSQPCTRLLYEHDTPHRSHWISFKYFTAIHHHASCSYTRYISSKLDLNTCVVVALTTALEVDSKQDPGTYNTFTSRGSSVSLSTDSHMSYRIIIQCLLIKTNSKPHY